jgi:hypothetical protein
MNTKVEHKDYLNAYGDPSMSTWNPFTNNGPFDPNVACYDLPAIAQQGASSGSGQTVSINGMSFSRADIVNLLSKGIWGGKLPGSITKGDSPNQQFSQSELDFLKNQYGASAVSSGANNTQAASSAPTINLGTDKSPFDTTRQQAIRMGDFYAGPAIPDAKTDPNRDFTAEEVAAFKQNGTFSTTPAKTSATGPAFRGVDGNATFQQEQPGNYTITQDRMNWQDSMQHAGYYTGVVDGKYGKLSAAGTQQVKQDLADAGLYKGTVDKGTVDGTADPAMWDAVKQLKGTDVDKTGASAEAKNRLHLLAGTADQGPAALEQKTTSEQVSKAARTEDLTDDKLAGSRANITAGRAGGDPGVGFQKQASLSGLKKLNVPGEQATQDAMANGLTGGKGDTNLLRAYKQLNNLTVTDPQTGKTVSAYGRLNDGAEDDPSQPANGSVKRSVVWALKHSNENPDAQGGVLAMLQTQGFGFGMSADQQAKAMGMAAKLTPDQAKNFFDYMNTPGFNDYSPQWQADRINTALANPAQLPVLLSYAQPVYASGA